MKGNEHYMSLSNPITVISGRLPARPITRTSRLLHTAKKKVQQITRTGG